jgi:ABC-type branched-subunit amino acid transport system permease subunit
MNWIFLLLLGAPAFGLEAMFLGLGGKVFALYRRKRRLVITGCLGIGLASTLPPVLISERLTLGVPETCLLLGLCIGAAGMVLSSFSKRIRGEYMPPLPEVQGEMERLKRRLRISGGRESPPQAA